MTRVIAVNRKQTLITAFGIGVVGGYLLKKGLDLRTPSPERVLAAVKAHVKRDLRIDGAWIHLQPENWMNGPLRQWVYRGGLTESVDGEAVHYDFIADARTGAVLRLERQS
jgi:predicted small secreted protein